MKFIITESQRLLIIEAPHTSWTPEKIKDEASKYNTTQEFLKNNPAAYAAAKRRNMLNDLFVKPLNKWNPNTIKQESSKYKTKKEFEIGNQPAYVAAHRLNMMDDLFPGKLTKMKGKSKYSDDLIKDVASNYISSNDFRKNEPRIWASAYLRNMIPNLFPKIK